MESSSTIREFASSFDIIQQNVMLSQLKYNTAALFDRLANILIDRIDESSPSMEKDFSDIDMSSYKNSRSSFSSKIYSNDIVEVYSTFTSTVSFSFYSYESFAAIELDPIAFSTVKLLFKMNLEKLLLLAQRKNIDFQKLAAKIFANGKLSNVFTVDLHSKNVDYGISAVDNEYYSNELNVIIVPQTLEEGTYVEKSSGPETKVYFLPDGSQIPSGSKLYTITFSETISTLRCQVQYTRILSDDSEAKAKQKRKDNKKQIISAIQSANPVGFKDLIMANTAEDDVFSTLLSFFRTSDKFESSQNSTSYLINMFNWNNAKPPEEGYTDTNNIGLLNSINKLKIIDSAHSTDSGVFSVFKFPTTKGTPFISSTFDDKYIAIRNGILQVTNQGKSFTTNFIAGVLGEMFKNIVGDSSQNMMEAFLSRTIGPTGTALVSCQQAKQLLYYIAKLLENIKAFSFNIYMKRNSTYLYKYTNFLATLYPEIPFNNNETDSYYQAVLDSPVFQHTGVSCRSLKTYSSEDNNVDDPTTGQNKLYSNFFELLYSSQFHYSEGKLSNPYSINSHNLIYTTIVSHRESPTFDVYDKNGSNGQLMYFVNYRTSTYNLTSHVEDIISMFGIEQGKIITKKNVLRAFYCIFSKWHENIRQLHCDIFCCHVNCHTAKYYPSDSMVAPESTDSVISKDIRINYHFYGWKETDDGDEEIDTAASNPNAIFPIGIKSQMVLPNDETITTWSSSRQSENNDGYHSSDDQLRIKVRFPEYHGSSSRIEVYAEYNIRDYFSINNKSSNYSARGTADKYECPIEMKSPYAVLGNQVQNYLESKFIICEDRLDATGTVGSLLNFIPYNYYLTGDHDVIDLDEDGTSKNTMISCIPLEIDVYFKATLDNPPTYGQFPLDEAIFEVIEAGSDAGYVFPDSANFSSPRVYDGYNVSINGIDVDRDYAGLGPFVENRQPGIDYFATEFCPSLNLYSCKISNGNTLGTDSEKYTDLTSYFANYYPDENPDMQTIMSKECNILYNNKNGIAGTTGTITLVAKNGARIFNGSTTIHYTVNVISPLSLTDETIQIQFDSNDMIDGKAATLSPRVICRELYGDYQSRDISESILEIQRPYSSSSSGSQIIKAIVFPNASSDGHIYYSGSRELTCELYISQDDKAAYDDGLALLGTKSLTWKLDKKDEEGDDSPADTSWGFNVDGSDIKSDVPFRVKAEMTMSTEAADIWGRKVVIGSVSLMLTLSYSDGTADKEFICGMASYSAKKGNGDEEPMSPTRTIYYEVPESNLKNISSITVTVVGSICGPNHNFERTMDASVWCNYYKACTVILDHAGGSYDGSTSNTKLTVQYLVVNPRLAHIPEKAGYKFNGYWKKASSSANAQHYIDSSGNWLIAWKSTADTTIIAHWNKIYTITLDRNGGDGGSDITYAANGFALETIVPPTRTGWNFQGYYSTKTSGTQYINSSGYCSKNWDKDSGSTLYAHWSTKTTTITFSKNGGKSGTSSAKATWGKSMPSITKPSRTGYTFAGYFDNSTTPNKQYYDSNAKGISGVVWDHEDATYTLTAHWTA